MANRRVNDCPWVAHPQRHVRAGRCPMHRCAAISPRQSARSERQSHGIPSTDREPPPDRHCETGRLTAPALRVALVDRPGIHRGWSRPQRRLAAGYDRHASGPPTTRSRVSAPCRGRPPWALGSRRPLLQNGILFNREPALITRHSLTDGDLSRAGGNPLNFREEGRRTDGRPPIATSPPKPPPRDRVPTRHLGA